MENRKRLVLALCSVGTALAIAGVSVRAPGRTLYTFLSPAPRPGSPGFGGCKNGEPNPSFEPSIASVARGIGLNPSTGRTQVLCSVKDYDGSTHHTACSIDAVVMQVSVVNEAFGTSDSRCTAQGSWGSSLKCSASVSNQTSAPPAPPCTDMTFTATAVSNDK